jgi:hypothetical protein
LYVLSGKATAERAAELFEIMAAVLTSAQLSLRQRAIEVPLEKAIVCNIFLPGRGFCISNNWLGRCRRRLCCAGAAGEQGAGDGRRRRQWPRLRQHAHRRRPGLW